MAECIDHPRILLVEDNFIIAEGLRVIVENAGMEVMGPALSLPQALELIEELPSLEAAIVDLNLNGEASLPVLDVLMARAVPVLLMTGYDISVLPMPYRTLANCEKPVCPVEIIEQVRALIATGRHARAT